MIPLFFPLYTTKKLMQRCQSENRSIIFYAHPWEFDTELPKVDLGLVGKFRHYYGIAHFLARLDEITDLFPFTSFQKAELVVDYNLTLGTNSTAFAF